MTPSIAEIGKQRVFGSLNSDVFTTSLLFCYIFYGCMYVKIAVDKDSYNKIKKRENVEYVYVFDKENLSTLKDVGMRCIHKDYIDFVDINLTSYEIDCIKNRQLQVCDNSS